MVKLRYIVGILLIGCLISGPGFNGFWFDHFGPTHIEGEGDMMMPMVYWVIIIVGMLMTFIGLILVALGRSWPAAMFFTFFSILTLGPYLIASLMGALAFLLLVFARPEFRSEQEPVVERWEGLGPPNDID